MNNPACQNIGIAKNCVVLKTNDEYNLVAKPSFSVIDQVSRIYKELRIVIDEQDNPKDMIPRNISIQILST